MDVNVVIMPDGSIRLGIEKGGSYAEGKAAIARLLEQLAGAGIVFESVGEIEQHVHEAGEHAANHVHEGGQ